MPSDDIKVGRQPVSSGEGGDVFSPAKGDGTGAKGAASASDHTAKMHIVRHSNNIRNIYDLLINMGRKAVAGATFALVVLGFMINGKIRSQASAEAMGEWTLLESFIAGALLLVVYLCFYIVLRGRRLQRHVLPLDRQLLDLFDGSMAFAFLLEESGLHEENIKHELRFASQALMTVMLALFVAGFFAALHFFGVAAFYAGAVGSFGCVVWQRWYIEHLLYLKQQHVQKWEQQQKQEDGVGIEIFKNLKSSMEKAIEYLNIAAARRLLLFFAVCAALFAGVVLAHWVHLA